ncbi:MAG TPA: nuclear transport factor 2 family protein [Pedomonas sp.]|uniref:nuclear transport factor 2 family protein n=1 Tax=Pedomonas sp. TaxID=2976421 RepID=UPI002F3FA47F
MTDTEKLLAVLEIQALKARYFRCMDSKDWAGLEAVFAPDVETDFRDSTMEHNPALLIRGAAPYVANLAPMLEHVTTVHHGHMPEIEILSPTSARGVWAMEDKLWVKEGAPLPFRWLHGYGHYHETYTKLNGDWRIQTIRLTRLRVDAG